MRLPATSRWRCAAYASNGIAQNYALYRRVDHLIDEGRELKQQLVAMKRKKADVAKVVQGEDETRHNALTGVDKAITAVRDRLEQYVLRSALGRRGCACVHGITFLIARAGNATSTSTPHRLLEPSAQA